MLMTSENLTAAMCDMAFDCGETCAGCGKLVDGKANLFYFDRMILICDSCADILQDTGIDQATRFVDDHCRIIKRLPPFNLNIDWVRRLKKHDKSPGNLSALDAYRCYCMLDRTNYIELLGGIDRSCLGGRLLFHLLNIRAFKMVDTEIATGGLLPLEAQGQGEPTDADESWTTPEVADLLNDIVNGKGTQDESFDPVRQHSKP